VEGLNISLVLSGATLVSLLGIGVRLMISQRGQKIGPQPFQVVAAERHTPQAQCDERHKELNSKADNLFARMSAAEIQLGAFEARQESLERQLGSMDAKLDKLLKR